MSGEIANRHRKMKPRSRVMATSWQTWYEYEAARVAVSVRLTFVEEARSIWIAHFAWKHDYRPEQHAKIVSADSRIRVWLGWFPYDDAKIITFRTSTYRETVPIRAETFREIEREREAEANRTPETGGSIEICTNEKSNEGRFLFDWPVGKTLVFYTDQTRI